MGSIPMKTPERCCDHHASSVGAVCQGFVVRAVLSHTGAAYTTVGGERRAITM